jgi:hypothetical protein
MVPSWPSNPSQSVRRLALRHAADESPPRSPRLRAIARLAAPPKARPWPTRGCVRRLSPRTPCHAARATGVAALLFVFVAATLVMVTAVIAAVIVDRWWVLAPVMLVDFATTFGVVAYIMRLLADDGEAPRSTPR